jgi:uncharacterized protein
MNDITSVMAPRLLAELQGEMLCDSPNLAAIQRRLESEYGFSPRHARDLIWQTVLQINSDLFPPVTKLEIIHTEGCNLACTYCFEKDMLGPRRMDRSIGLAAVDLLFAYSGDEETLYITHFGGEPTLNFPAIRAITEYAEEKARHAGKRLELHMTSNGVVLDEDMAAYFAEHRIMVLLSIDGMRDSHDRFRVDRRGRGTFDKVMEGFRFLKRTQDWVGVKMTVMPENAPHLFSDVIGLYGLGVNQFLIDYATGIAWTRESMDVYTQQLAKVYRWYKDRPRTDLKIHDFDQEPGADGAFFGCQAGRNSVTASISGEISPCSKVLALNNRQLLMKLGDVRYGLTHLRNRLELTGCGELIRNCEAQGIAERFQGGCFAANYEDNGNLFQPSMQDHTFAALKRSACSGCAGCGR